MERAKYHNVAGGMHESKRPMRQGRHESQPASFRFRGAIFFCKCHQPWELLALYQLHHSFSTLRDIGEGTWIVNHTSGRFRGILADHYRHFEVSLFFLFLLLLFLCSFLVLILILFFLLLFIFIWSSHPQLHSRE